MPSWTGNGQLASSRSSTPPARFGRATDAAGPAHHGLGSSPIVRTLSDAVVVFDGALHVCACVCVCVSVVEATAARLRASLVLAVVKTYAKQRLVHGGASIELN